MPDIKKHLVYFSHFVTGQFLLQALNLLNGFFLLRWLSISQQAKFSVAFSIQSLILSLSDLGFTGSIIALVGNRFNDKRVVGAYIGSAKQLRNYLFLFSCGIVMLILPFIIKKQSWGILDLFLILSPVLLAVFWQADCSLYDSTLIMHRKMKEFYKPQVVLAALKLTTNFLLNLIGIIGAFSTLLLNAIVLLINGKSYKRMAAEYVEIPANSKNSPELKEMVNYLKPLFPGLIFTSFYGQIQIFLISFFGKTSNIADIAALGKLGQIFLFLNSINSVIIAPLIAKANSKNLVKKYISVLCLSILIAVSIFLFELVFPGVFLFLLGSKYQHLKNLLNLMIINACLSYLTNTIWVISSARKWVYWWGTMTYISIVIICQIIGIFYFDLSNTEGILKMTFLTSMGALTVHFCINMFGLVRENIGTKTVTI